ncbi:MAG: beta-glucosidase, partial [Calditrichales bacterium]
RLVKEIGHITGEEGKVLGYTNIYSPILDLARDPRWGRTVECYSEDPFLVAQMGLAQVKALQAEGVASTPKHFAVYSVPKGGRDGEARTDPHVARREMEMTYLYPFKIAFTQGGALGTMSSYNDYDGIPITGSHEFLVDILRDKWGFKGYVVSDSRAVDYIFSKHHVAADYKEAVRQAVEAGLNIRTNFSKPEVYVEPLRELAKEGKLSMEVIDARVRDILRVKYILGLFDHPYVINPEKADAIVASAEHKQVALEASRKSIVMLKNENKVLPLSKSIKTILVAGPNADAIQHSISRYGPSKIDVISVLKGIRQQVSAETEILYAKGCEIKDERWPESEILPEDPTPAESKNIEVAVELAKKADVAIVVIGGDETTTGESKSRTSLDLPGFQLDLIKAINQTGTPTIAVLINGRPLTINWVDKHVPAIIEAWFPGEKGGQAVAEVLFGTYNPGGKLPITFPKTVGQLPLDFPYKPGSDAGSKENTRIMGVLYPFGYGLSYTTFAYKNLKLTPAKQLSDKQITVECEITNTGPLAGDEVVQLYIRDEVSSVTTYVKNLRGFERVSLKPGETQRVSFVIQPEHLTLINAKQEEIVEPGRFNVYIGSSSEDIRLEGEFEII